MHVYCLCKGTGPDPDGSVGVCAGPAKEAAQLRFWGRCRGILVRCLARGFQCGCCTSIYVPAHSPIFQCLSRLQAPDGSNGTSLSSLGLPAASIPSKRGLLPVAAPQADVAGHTHVYAAAAVAGAGTAVQAAHTSSGRAPMAPRTGSRTSCWSKPTTTGPGTSTRCAGSIPMGAFHAGHTPRRAHCIGL